MPVNIHGKQYETVAERISKFRADEATKLFSVLTELVSNDNEYVVIKALIHDLEGRTIATGYAQEKYGSSNINQTSALENCETSAIGRALANFGLAGSEFASADEVATAIKQQSEGVSYSPKGGEMSEKQKNWLEKIAKTNGYADIQSMANEHINRYVKTVSDAKQLIDTLMQEGIIEER